MSEFAKALMKKATPPKAEEKKSSKSYLKEAIKEAWEASKSDDFEGFSSALESALSISRHEVEKE
jgi:Zn-dependent M32 family carboxypeptidase